MGIDAAWFASRFAVTYFQKLRFRQLVPEVA
jgi:hypothetical protein